MNKNSLIFQSAPTPLRNDFPFFAGLIKLSSLFASRTNFLRFLYQIRICLSLFNRNQIGLTTRFVMIHSTVASSRISLNFTSTPTIGIFNVTTNNINTTLAPEEPKIVYRVDRSRLGLVHYGQSFRIIEKSKSRL